MNSQESTNNNGKSNFSDFVNKINPSDQIDVPLYASLPSRVLQIINVIVPEDVLDDLEYREIVEDIRNVMSLIDTGMLAVWYCSER